MIPRGRELGAIALRLALGLPLLIALAQVWGRHYVALCLPWYRGVLTLVLPDYAVAALRLVRHNGEWLIAGQFVSLRALPVHDRLLPAGIDISATTLMDHALKHPLILLAGVLAWPGLSWRGRGLRLLCSLPFLGLLETVDVPLVLASAVRDLVSWGVSPQADAASWAVDWVRVLDGGGRVAFGLGAAWAAAGLHGWLGRCCGRAASA